ncbi:prephenate dehydratase [Nesterenkonia ebinurensis]|uniref:prephenate dehydratase n=1 Tax=Nesterenkonia ebinurensis TaxID=2608252 RepID=UPI00123D9CF5|nr:prephenate dehydratase domain-containing protein [Nesterenkonia ebinurensis]
MSHALGAMALSSEEPSAESPRISFLGPSGTFSESVVDYIFEDLAIHRSPQGTIGECVDSLRGGNAEYAVVPVENSTGGVVPDFWDLLAAQWQDRTWNLELDVVSDVSQHLFASAALVERHEEPTKIFSHWQALRQCRKYLDRIYPKAERVPVDSTAEAGRIAQEFADEPFAAIGHRNIGDRFGLVRIASSVEDNPFNQTRFVVLSSREAPKAGTWIDAAEHRALTYHSVESSGLTSVPSTLAEIEASRGWELTGCYSLPKPGYMGEYNVFMDWRTTSTDTGTHQSRPNKQGTYVVVDAYHRVP